MKWACIGAPDGNIYAAFKIQPDAGMLYIYIVYIIEYCSNIKDQNHKIISFIMQHKANI